MFRFRTPQLLFKRLVKSQPPQTKKVLTLLSWQNMKNPILFSTVQSYYFSSFQQIIHPIHRAEYQEEELALLNDFEPEKLPERRRVMEKYLHCKDLGLLNPDDIALISDTLCSLAVAHNLGGNKDKALKYLKEDEDLNQKAGIRDTIGLAHNFYVQGCIYLDQNNLKDAQHYLDESDRICLLLGENKEAKGLRLHCCCSFARKYYLQNDQDKALELYHSVLDRVGDLPEEQLPGLIFSVSEGLGAIYASRNDIENTMEHWTKCLNTSTQLYGENSLETYSFSTQITEFLYRHGQDQRALLYAKQSLKIALQIYPNNHPEVALNYSRLGHGEKNNTKALDSYKKAIQIFEKHPPQETADYLSSCYFQSARILALQNKPQEASNFLARAGPSIALILDGKELASVYFKWAEELRDLENMMEDCKSYFLKATKLYESSEPKDSPKLVDIYAALGHISYLEQDWEKTCELMKKSESYFEAAKTEPLDAKLVYAGLSSASILLGNTADAWKYTQKVIECFEACGNPQHVGEAYFHFAVLHEREGRLREALEAFKKSVKIPEMAPPGSYSRISVAQDKIVEIENKLKIVNERNSEASSKTSQVLKTFKNSAPKK